MSRRMSCSMTIDAVRNQTKTVTRRHVDTWRDLKPGDRLTLIEKGMGLPKGAKQVVLAEVEIVTVDVEPLYLVDDAECDREGLPELMPVEFMVMWLASHGYGKHVGEFVKGGAGPASVDCRRIEWRYLEEDK